MLSKKMEDVLNKQINNEMYSAYLYMSMASYADTLNFKGVGTWFMVQYHEEMFHAMKMYNYLLHQGAKPQLFSIKQPPSEYKTVLDMFEKTLEHEKFITKSINDLVDLAISERDHATQIFLNWYVTEQVEEESNDNEIIAQLSLIKDNPNGLFMLDKQLGSRTTTVQTDFSQGIQASQTL